MSFNNSCENYQVESINNVRRSLASGHKRVALMLPTGAGKSAIAATITKSAKDKNKRVWFIVDNIELVDQTVNVFESFGLDVGVIQGIHDKTDYRKDVIFWLSALGR